MRFTRKQIEGYIILTVLSLVLIFFAEFLLTLIDKL